MSVKIAINGFGRIGRMAFRQLFEMEGFEVVAVNDLASIDMLTYLLKYDSAQPGYPHSAAVTHNQQSICINDREIAVYNESNAELLPWREFGVDIVLECSGAYHSRDKGMAHITAGAKKVVFSAPAGNDIPTIVYGINEQVLSVDDNFISAASCSTNALAPMVKALHDATPILSGIMTVVHGYTASQMLVDSPQKGGSLRRSRAAASNIVPATAGAATAVARVIPELAGRLTGSAIRVPVPCGCLITLTAVVEGSDLTESAVNDIMKAASSDIFGYSEEEYVSSDIIGMTCASLFDATQTVVCHIRDNLYEVRVAAWFDNENSFASQMVRIIRYVAAKSTAEKMPS